MQQASHAPLLAALGINETLIVSLPSETTRSPFVPASNECPRRKLPSRTRSTAALPDASLRPWSPSPRAAAPPPNSNAGQDLRLPRGARRLPCPPIRGRPARAPRASANRPRAPQGPPCLPSPTHGNHRSFARASRSGRLSRARQPRLTQPHRARVPCCWQRVRRAPRYALASERLRRRGREDGARRGQTGPAQREAMDLPTSRPTSRPTSP